MDRLNTFLYHRRYIISISIVILALFLSTYLSVGNVAQNIRFLVLLGGLVFGMILLQNPSLRPFIFILIAMVYPLQINTGTEVQLNLITLFVPVLFALRVLDILSRRADPVPTSSTTVPLILFLCAGILSLLIGNVLWDPAVPRSSNFIIIQLAQWSIFAFSLGAFWLSSTMMTSVAIIEKMCKLLFVVGGGFACLQIMPGGSNLVVRFGTRALVQPPFWILLAALSLGQLLFNYQNLSKGWRIYLSVIGVVTLIYAFIQQRESLSSWGSVAAVAGTLLWLRFPRLRGLVLFSIGILITTGILFPSLYEFAGGDDEWILSGGSRIALIERVIQVTMRNPITGLGPASYRPYTSVEPLKYQNAFWVNPKINSHNNYVDIFAHTGLLGVGLFLWFMGELGWLGWQRSAQYRSGFVGGYVNAMLAIWVGSLVLMMLADWMLPFVYNIGFPGFQASVLVWLFFGGLVSVRGGVREGESGGVGEGVRG